jgi:hypothetical protein
LKRESPIERQILDYLARNRKAQDTLRGILEWWLLKQWIIQSQTEVEAALRRLVAKRKLRAVLGRDGQVRYQLREITRVRNAT